MMEEKLLSMLGIARRAAKLAMGYDAAYDAMQKGKCRLLVLSADLSERTMKSIREQAQRSGTEICCLDCTMELLGKAVGRKQTGIIAINDSGFAKSVKALCGENSQEECI